MCHDRQIWFNGWSKKVGRGRERISEWHREKTRQRDRREQREREKWEREVEDNLGCGSYLDGNGKEVSAAASVDNCGPLRVGWVIWQCCCYEVGSGAGYSATILKPNSGFILLSYLEYLPNIHHLIDHTNVFSGAYKCNYLDLQIVVISYFTITMLKWQVNILEDKNTV